MLSQLNQLSLLFLFALMFLPGTYAQVVELEGKAKITQMDPATGSASNVMREPDGTLSLEISSTYAVGDFAHGGVVFWVNATGEHGKVVSIYDIGAVPWSNITATEIGASSQSNINGAGNTVAIMQQSGHERSAARHCADLAYRGYDDWYLPAINELQEIYNNKTTINTVSVANGGEVVANERYWSSTEGFPDAVFVINFSDGSSGGTLKTASRLSRAIRAF